MSYMKVISTHRAITRPAFFMTIAGDMDRINLWKFAMTPYQPDHVAFSFNGRAIE